MEHNDDQEVVAASQRRANVLAYLRANEGKQFGRKDIAIALGHAEPTKDQLDEAGFTLNELAGAGQINVRKQGTNKFYSAGDMPMREASPGKISSPGKGGQSVLAKLLGYQKELEAKIERARSEEKDAAIEGIRETIAMYGITRDELFGKRSYSRPQVREPQESEPAKKVRRMFTDKEKAEMVVRHVQLHKDGLSHDAACQELGVAGSVMRNWYRQFPPPKRQRKAA